MATIATIAGAVIGAAGSYASAKEANKKRNAYTSSTSTQNPYMWENLNPRLEDVLNLQGSLVDQGAPQVGPDGRIYYAGLPGRGSTYTAEPPGPPRPPGAGGSGADGRGGRKPPKNKRAGAGVGAGTGAGVGAGTGSSPPPASAEDIFRQAAARGFETGNTTTQQQARTAMGNILGEAGGGGPESTGFEGYNPILDRMASGLGDDFENRVGRDLLLGFLDENGRGGRVTSGGAGGGMDNPRSGRYGPPAYIQQMQGAGTPGSPGSVPGQVPDTMVPDSYFGQQTRRIMDEEANQAELESMISLMNQDVEKGMFRDLAALDAAAQGSGRFGGDMWAAANRDAREEGLQEMSKTAAQVRVGDRESRRQARLAALSGVNSRDQALLAAQVQREGIAAGERSASASASAAGASAAENAALARRGQDLSALGALLDYEKFGTGQLSGIGQQLSSDRLNTLGLVPGLEGIGIEGLNVALGGGRGLADIRANAANNATARAGINLQRQGQLQQLGMFNAGQQQNTVNDYLRTLLGIGGLGGTATTNGVNVMPGAGVSPTGSALTGAIGGAATGAGIYGSYQNSDLALKDNVTEIGQVGDIRLVEWDWKPGNIYGLEGHDFGVIAQELEQVMPQAVAYDDFGYAVVDYKMVGDYLLSAGDV